jgi:hypothetical protein
MGVLYEVFMFLKGFFELLLLFSDLFCVGFGAERPTACEVRNVKKSPRGPGEKPGKGRVSRRGGRAPGSGTLQWGAAKGAEKAGRRARDGRLVWPRGSCAGDWQRGARGRAGAGARRAGLGGAGKKARERSPARGGDARGHRRGGAGRGPWTTSKAATH